MVQDITFQFENLQVYQKALEVIDKVYQYTRSFPKEEIYGMTSQFRRAVVSIALNITESSARSKKDFRRFLDMAHGSICECIALLSICKQRKYIEEISYSQLRISLGELAKMVSGLKRSIGFPGRSET